MVFPVLLPFAIASAGLPERSGSLTIRYEERRHAAVVQGIEVGLRLSHGLIPLWLCDQALRDCDTAKASADGEEVCGHQ
jgi:hypothetical protein